MTYFDDDPYLNATVHSDLQSTHHGRQRREERAIPKVNLLNARRYGMEEPARNGCLKYTYGGVVFIYSPRSNQEVTSYPSKDKGSTTSGTRVCKPVLLSKRHEFDNARSIQRHDATRDALRKQPSKWKSHSVLVVDMSGSMRRDDVSGARCRSDGVWMALARDFLRRQLTDNSATPQDLISVIVMQDTAKIVLLCEPTDWVLYNTFVDMRDWKEFKPSGPGNYAPALDLAEAVLKVSGGSSSCGLSLMFFSDGRPSDKGDFSEHMGKIASRFGRRLTVCCIGMADQTEDFSTLQGMVQEATSYGCIASFNKPSLTTDSLSNIITSLVTSLTSTKTELTSVHANGTTKQRLVRMDVSREKRNAPDDFVLTDDWTAFSNNSFEQYVMRIWTWDYRTDDFVMMMDPRCLFCYTVVADTQTFEPTHNGCLCPRCKACFTCRRCLATENWKKHPGSAECRRFLTDRRHGKYKFEQVTSFAVAMKKQVFGEGAERLVHKFRFLNERDEFVGPKMVAKQSRFIEAAASSYEERMDYHREFMRTQSIASELADKFNQALDALQEHFDPAHHRILKQFPRIRFLKPLVVEIIDQGSENNILVEEFLEGQYQKFNNNMGYVQGQTPQQHNNAPAVNDFDPGRNQMLGAIEEEDEEEEESDEEEIFVEQQAGPDHGVYDNIKDSQFPQAFSHFTYEKSKKQLMVVDLQGVFRVYEDRTREYILTDPAIHKRKKRRQLKHWTFGRADRGEKGMKAFFASHQCNDACRLLGLSEKGQM